MAECGSPAHDDRVKGSAWQNGVIAAIDRARQDQAIDGWNCETPRPSAKTCTVLRQRSTAPFPQPRVSRKSVAASDCS
jgi:hypothetical protein